jgi:putative flippase GtrA
MYFFKYSLIGIINTILHIFVFFILHHLYNFNQSISNLIAFSIVVTFSYFINSKYNFKSKYNIKKYIFFVVSMGLISFGIGFISDKNQIDPFETIIIFTLISLTLGFFLSKYFIFKGQ